MNVDATVKENNIRKREQNMSPCEAARKNPKHHRNGNILIVFLPGRDPFTYFHVLPGLLR